MAIDFPASPTLNQTFTSGNVNYVWDGTKWTAAVSGGIALDKIEEGNTSVEVVDTGSDGRVVFTTEGNEVGRFDSSGRLGLGTSTPGSYDAFADDFVIANGSGNPGITLAGSTSGWGSIYFADGTTGNEPYRGYIQYGHTNDRMTFATAGTGALFIDSSQRVGVGTTSPSEVLTVSKAQSTNVFPLHIQNSQEWGWGVGLKFRQILSSGGGISDSAAIISDWDGNNNSTLEFQTKLSGSLSEKARITPSGQLLVGTSTSQGSYNLQCFGTGVWGQGAYVNGSDANIKQNIQDLEPALDVIKAMRPVTFQYKQEYSSDQTIQPGFIAQELQAAMAGKAYVDGVVQQGTTHLNVAYSSIIAVLVKAVQELEAKVAALEAA